MKYIKLKIRNFKGIRDLTLDLGSSNKFKIFTLVGLNESGKTTILEAIDFFQNDIRKTERHTLIPKDRKANFSDHISVSATLELDAEDEETIKKHAKSVGFNIEQPIKKISLEKKYIFKNSEYVDTKRNWIISLIGKLKSGRKTRKLDNKNNKWGQIVIYIRTELLPPIIYYPNFLISFPNKIYLQEREKESKEQEFYRKVVQDILDSLGDNLTIDEHIITRIKKDTEEAKESLGAVIDRMGAKVTKVILKSWEKIFRQAGKREIIIKPGVEELEEGQKRYYLEMKLKIGAEQYQIKELCLGFKWFFAFLLFTEFRKNRVKDRGEILFLLDEPASNLHSTAQNRLKETFGELIDKSKLIYATHSHHLIKPEWLEGAFIVKNKALDYKTIDYDTSRTDIEAIPYRQFVAQYPDQSTYFKPILDSLDYRPSDLELVPSMVLVEGKNDFYTFKYINEVILGNKLDSLHFYPGRGAGKNDQVIRLYINWGRRFVVFEDGDEAGEKGKEKYIREIGDSIKDKIFILSDIDKKWKGFCTENLFSEKEKLRVIQAIFPNAKTQSKQKLNKAIQNLLFLRQSVSLNKTTMKRFEKIFKFLNEKLNQK